jgi:ADP-heptose:LPS heptosyltransferase
MNLRRSLELAQLAPLGVIPGAVFVSLQKGEAGAQTAAGLTLHDFTEELTDFADTAALVAALDLVISVDTSVVHLAGALGKPVWVLDRYDSCWRWLIGRTDSPWYPTLRLFRQPSAGDWASAITAARDALGEWIGEF